MQQYEALNYALNKIDKVFEEARVTPAEIKSKWLHMNRENFDPNFILYYLELLQADDLERLLAEACHLIARLQQGEQ